MTKPVTIQVRVEREVDKEIKIRLKGETKSEWVRRAIKEKLEKNET